MVRAHLDCLWRVDDVLSKSKVFDQVSPIRAEVPSVSAVHILSGLRVQFQCGEALPAALTYVENYKLEYPALHSIYTVLRMILETRGLFGRQHGGVGPYTLIIMTSAALKFGEGTFHRRDAAAQLLHVLRFYVDATFRATGLSVEPPGWFHKQSSSSRDQKQLEQQNPYLRGQRVILKAKFKSETMGQHRLCIQNPAEYMEDLGAHVYTTEAIRATFKGVYDGLKYRMRQFDEEDEEEAARHATGGQVTKRGDTRSEKERRSMLRFALGANYDDFELVRDRIVFADRTALPKN
jgi:hypothetical protein